MRVTVIGVFNPKRKKPKHPAVANHRHIGGGETAGETAGRLRGGRVRGIGGMADDESFFVSADEADDDGRRAPGHAPPRATPRDPEDASTTTTTTTMAHRRLGSDSDDDDAVDRTANETMEGSDASFVSGDDAGGDALGRGARDAGAETTTTTETAIALVGGEASGTDGEFVSGADTDTGVDGRARPTATRARAPGRAPPPLRTRQATAPALSEGEEEAATNSNHKNSHSHQPASPGTMLNEAWELAMRAQDDPAGILDEDDPPTPLTLFKDALEGQGDGDKHREEEDEDEEEGGFASAGGDGAGDPAPGPAVDDHQPTGPGDASDPDRSFGADDSFADPALDLDDDDGAGEGDASTPSKSVSSKSVSLLRSRPAPLSPPSPLIAPSDRASFRLVRQSSAGVSSGVSSVAAPQPSSGRDKVGGWGEGVTGDVQTRRMSKAEEVLKAATRHSSDDDDVDELASSSDGEGAGPGRGGGPSTPISSSLAPRLARGLSSGSGGGSGSGSFSPYFGSDGDFSPHGSSHGGSDSASRRTERRRLQKERYLAKLHNGFDGGGAAGADAESLRRRAEALRRNASSEPEPASSRLRHSWSGGGGGGGGRDRDRDSRKWLDAGPGGRTRGGFETTGERRGSTRLTASASLRESESAVLAAGRDPRRTRSGGFAGEAIGSPAGGSPMGAMGSPMGAMMGSPGSMMGSPMGAMMGSPGAMPMPAFGGAMGLMAPQLQHAQMQHMIMMQQQMQEQMRRYQEQMQMQMAGMSVQSPQAPVANAATSQGVTEERLRRVFHLVADNADDEVMGLIDSGAVGVDLADDGGNTLLMASCAAGHKRLSRHLVKRGSGLNKRNAEGNTALHFALAMGHVELGDFLVAKGADDGVTNNYGMSPFEGLAPEKDGGGWRRQHRY